MRRMPRTLVDLLNGGLVGVGHVGGRSAPLPARRLVQLRDNGAAHWLHLLLLVLELLSLNITKNIFLKKNRKRNYWRKERVGDTVLKKISGENIKKISTKKKEVALRSKGNVEQKEEEQNAFREQADSSIY